MGSAEPLPAPSLLASQELRKRYRLLHLELKLAKHPSGSETQISVAAAYSQARHPRQLRTTIARRARQRDMFERQRFPAHAQGASQRDLSLGLVLA